MVTEPAVVILCDPDGLVTGWGPGAETLFGVRAVDAIGRPLDALVEERGRVRTDPDHAAERGRAAAETAAERPAGPMDLWWRRGAGTAVMLRVTASPLVDESGRVTAVVWLAGDTDAAGQAGTDPGRRAAGRAADVGGDALFAAAHDPLTGLANRAVLLHRLDQAASGRDGVGGWELLLIDVDGFKAINDTYGPAVGDEVLRLVGSRLAGMVRPDDLVARTSGDEFAVLARSPARGGGSSLARRVALRIGRPADITGRTITVTAGIGVARLHAGRPDAARQVLRRADFALSAAKATGTDGTWRRYDKTMETGRAGQVELVGQLRSAIADGEITVAYQPICDAATGRPVAVEALARWHHPDRGHIPPDVFIPAAERAGLIDLIGRRVLHTACRDIAALGETVAVAVNLSPRQLADPNLAATVHTALTRSGLAAGRLILELTETAMPTTDSVAARQLDRLRRLGVGLAVDDFGTGQSSLSRLHRLPFTTVKIDRSFVGAIGRDDGAETIIAAASAMAHGLHMTVIAEGVETTAQLDRLRALGADRIQGFLTGRPQPITRLAEHLKRTVTTPNPSDDTAPADDTPAGAADRYGR